jgi:polyisoprenoid-binding protein YceI
MHSGSTLRRSLILGLLLGLAACAPLREAPPIQTESGQPWPANARELRIEPGESDLRILVYRAGTLAALGHNHVISTREVSGRVAYTDDLSRAYLEIEVPVSSFEVDRPELRAEAGEDFAGEIDAQAVEGTRANLLGEKVLDAERYPEIRLFSRSVSGTLEALTIRAAVRVRDQTSEVEFPVQARWQDGALIATGKLSLPQSSLGLEPFSVFLGALAVQDDMDLQFRLVARPWAGEPVPD